MTGYTVRIRNGTELVGKMYVETKAEAKAYARSFKHPYELGVTIEPKWGMVEYYTLKNGKLYS